MTKYKPNKQEIFAKNSSLAIYIYKDSKYDFDFHVYDRNTNRIVYQGAIPLVTLRAFMNLDSIVKPKKKKKSNYIPVGRRTNDQSN